MNKTVNITINRLVFSLEEDAYVRLNGYLEDIKRHFSGFSYGGEVVSDIESRIAEQFQTIIGSKQQVITMEDVNGLIRIMGTVADIASDQDRPASEDALPNPPKPPVKRRLYRSTDNVMIGGVAAGLAAYFDWDVTLMRLLFVLVGLTTFVIGPYAIAAYLIFWLVVPKAETAAAKLEMRGEDVTIAKLEKNAKEQAQDRKFRQPVKEISSFAGRLIRLAVKVIAILCGIGIAASAFFGIVFSTMIFAQLLFNSGSPYVDFPVRSIFPGTEFFILLCSGFFLLLVPAILLLLAGLSLIRRRPSFGKVISAVMIGTWVIALATVSVIVIKEAPKIDDTAQAYRRTTTQTYDNLQGFQSIKVSGTDRVNVTYGKEYSVTATYLDKDPDRISIVKNGDTLEIGHESRRPRVCVFCPSRRATVAVTMPELIKLEAGDVSDVTIENFKLDSLELNLSGSSSAEITGLEAKNLSIIAGGTSRAGIGGKSKKIAIQVSQVGRIEAENLTYDSAEIKASDSSRVVLGTGINLKVTVGDVARVYYAGSPAIDSILSEQGRLLKSEKQTDQTENLE
ncbi:MAG: GIN domain-containing protein [Candidatus Saccharibacteria bacterium]